MIELEKQQQQSYVESRMETIEIIRTELNSLLRQKSRIFNSECKTDYYFNGPRPSHLLALKLRPNEKYTNIRAIESSNGLLADPRKINGEFCKFFSILYASEIILDSAKCKELLDSVTLHSLSHEESSDLGKQETRKERKELWPN